MKTRKYILKLYHRIGLQTNVRDAFVKEIIESQYKYAKEIIENFGFKGGLTKEEFAEIGTNFTFKYIGKIYTTHKLVSDFVQRKIDYEEKLKRKRIEEGDKGI